MISKIKSILIVILGIVIGATNLMAGPDQTIEKTFDAKNKVKIKLAISDCKVETSKDNKIHAMVIHSYSEDEYEVVFRESGNSLTIEEKFHDDHAGGSADWTVAVPAGTRIDVNSGTGDLLISTTDSEVDGNSGTGDVELSGASGEFELNSGTGSVLIKSSKGEFDLNSGTGKVKIRDSQGNFKANSGTGGVEVQNITITDEAEFNSGTGDAEIVSPSGKNYDLSINSGTGDAVLDLDGAEPVGYFELKADARSGRIKADLEFDREEEHGHGDNASIVKSVTIKQDRPRFYISTGTGTARLKK